MPNETDYEANYANNEAQNHEIKPNSGDKYYLIVHLYLNLN